MLLPAAAPLTFCPNIQGRPHVPSTPTLLLLAITRQEMLWFLLCPRYRLLGGGEGKVVTLGLGRNVPVLNSASDSDPKLLAFV